MLGGKAQTRSAADSLFANDGALLAQSMGSASAGNVSNPYQQIAWTFAAIGTISRAIASVPFRVMRGEEHDESHPLQSFFDRPSADLPISQFWTATICSLELTGDCYWILTAKDGRLRIGEPPYAAVPVNGRAIKPVDKSGRAMKSADLWARPSGYKLGDSSIILEPHEVCRFRYWDPSDRWGGMSPLEPARLSMQGYVASEAWNTSFFANAADPGGSLEVADFLSPDQQKQILKAWNDAHGGPWNRGKTNLAMGGTKYVPNGRSQKDAEFMRWLEWTRDELLVVHGVPKAILSITDQLNYATHLGQTRVFWETKILPLMQDIEGALWTFIFAGVENGALEGRFDTSQVPALSSDLTERIGNATAMANLGWSPDAVNERFRLGMPELGAIDPALGVEGDVIASDAPMSDAQIVALTGIVAQVADGTLPYQSAVELVQIAFPTIDAAAAAKLLGPAAKFSPAKPKEDDDSPPADKGTGDQPNPPAKSGDAPIDADSPSAGNVVTLSAAPLVIVHGHRMSPKEAARAYDAWVRDRVPAVNRRLTKAMRDYLASLKREQLRLMKAWRETYDLGDDAKIPPLTESDLRQILFARQKWDAEIKKKGLGPIGDIVKASADQAARELGVGFMKATDPLILEVRGRVVGALVQVNANTRKEVRSILIGAQSKGLTINETSELLAQRMEGIGGYPRALRIARTEQGFATSTTRYDVMQSEGIERHQWRASSLGPRPSHEATNGQIVTIGERFRNGLIHPHELGAPPEEVCNCSCRAVAVE
jgi:HK97 family phage portal protein